MNKFEISYDEFTNIWEVSDYRRADEEECEVGVVYRTEPVALFFNDSLTTTEFYVIVENTNLGESFIVGWNKINNHIKENKITLNSQSK